MATTLRTWLISAAAATGVVGGGVAGLTAASAPASGSEKAAPAASTPTGADELAALRAQAQALTGEDQSLHKALAEAKTRLARELQASERAMRAAQERAAQERAAAQRAAAQARQVRTVTTQQAPAVHSATKPAPSTHTTTGASGASGSSGDDSHEHDDGGGDD